MMRTKDSSLELETSESPTLYAVIFHTPMIEAISGSGSSFLH